MLSASTIALPSLALSTRLRTASSRASTELAASGSTGSLGSAYQSSSSSRNVTPGPSVSSSASVVTDLDYHTEYENKNAMPYKHIDVLGSGSFGFVDKVELPGETGHTTGRIFARKRIRLQRTKAGLEKQMVMIRAEIDIMRKLTHNNITKVMFTYRCGTEFGMLMTPVADCDLKEYMEELEPYSEAFDTTARIEQLRPWMVCLAEALDYLHREKVVHKDIKPANILVKDSNVYVTDFGIAKDLINETTTASTGTVSFKSPMYCAPEVSMQQRRGRSADVFSMGCVFLEMFTLLSGKSVLSFHESRKSWRSASYADNQDTVLDWLRQMSVTDSVHIDKSQRESLFSLCFLMLIPDTGVRLRMPAAVVAMKMIFPAPVGIDPWIIHDGHSSFSGTEKVTVLPLDASDNFMLASLARDSMPPLRYRQYERINVLRKHHSGLWYGCIANDQTRRGWFLSGHVKRVPQKYGSWEPQMAPNGALQFVSLTFVSSTEQPNPLEDALQTKLILDACSYTRIRQFAGLARSSWTQTLSTMLTSFTFRDFAMTSVENLHYLDL